MSSAKIEAAAKATDTIAQAWAEARIELNTLWVNGFGVLRDVSMARSDLSSAIAALKRAQAAMDATKWPTDADYELVDG